MVKKRVRRIIIILVTALVTFGLVTAAYNTVYFDFYTRKLMPARRMEPRLPHEVAYEPFTGQVFDIDGDQVDHIAIHSFSQPKSFFGKQEIDSVVDCLNSMRCHIWTPSEAEGYSLPPVILTLYSKTFAPVKYSEPHRLVLFVYGNRVRAADVNFYCGRELYDIVNSMWEKAGGSPYSQKTKHS